MITVLTLAFAFETSAALVYAFGMTVRGTITITTLLFFYIVWRHWSTPLWPPGPSVAVPIRAPGGRTGC